MKSIQILTLFLLLSGAMISCGGSEEDSTSEQNENKEVNLVGSWKALENAEGDEPMKPIADGITISFTEEMTWSMTYNGDEFAKGQYETQAGTVYCYVTDKGENDPQQYVWEYYYEGDKMILDGYYFIGNDKVNLKIITQAE